MNEPMLKKAMDTLEFLSQDAATRMEYEARMKYLRDEVSRMEGARSEGIVEGAVREKREMARKLLAMGHEVDFVVKLTELTEEEIRLLSKDVRSQ
ncbi:Rpn family recombination-promoting nuclease/putative transposase [Paenibacillus sonchi]|uniref:Rpn family recombination-promoting nuclease/putative transposase n=1 Tax=Paenibacillus sonchi TaxID=373687 RepID=UPI00031C1747|nr:Rpn family recombination-promoting nuclease/putative transposase [Paenibacillus sonchi]